jgi:hypothetical protein
LPAAMARRRNSFSKCQVDIYSLTCAKVSVLQNVLNDTVNRYINCGTWEHSTTSTPAHTCSLPTAIKASHKFVTHPSWLSTLAAVYGYAWGKINYHRIYGHVWWEHN